MVNEILLNVFSELLEEVMENTNKSINEKENVENLKKNLCWGADAVNELLDSCIDYSASLSIYVTLLNDKYQISIDLDFVDGVCYVSSCLDEDFPQFSIDMENEYEEILDERPE